MVWQSVEEKRANNELYAKVTGRNTLAVSEWNQSVTWSGSVLLALSTEQSMKSVAILRSKDRGCLKTHNLSVLPRAMVKFRVWAVDHQAAFLV